jgi:predicted XRE-type DNA-binding protein
VASNDTINTAIKMLMKINTKKKKKVYDQAIAMNEFDITSSSVSRVPKMKNITDFNEYSKVWKMYTYGPNIRYTMKVKPPKQGINTTKNVKIVDIAYK